MPSSAGEPLPENSRLIFIADPARTERESKPTPNSIRTTKSPAHRLRPRETAFVPLGVVLFATAVKDAYEDYRRHRSDKTENNRSASVLSTSSRSFVSVPWKHVRAGDIVRVVANESIPCDLALLSTSDPTGAVFVQTINLDGESNLKTRYALQETLHRDPEYWLEYGQEPAAIRCEMPNLNIYGFRANIEIDDRKLPLGPNNILLRGCEIKNTEWAVGVAVYTGMETKVMLNNSGASSKRSRLETRMNREILMLAATMVALCTIVATCTGVWLHQNRDRLDTLPFYRKGLLRENGEELSLQWDWSGDTLRLLEVHFFVSELHPDLTLHIHGNREGHAVIYDDPGQEHVP
ncbi:hypothetical protein J5N97_013580 [Dioscorea zingiberensis]|uniref:P-type ATPase A domain-containing protein n=1 Tax=Dioscorea zingiberensis TaxID=325984 RepID=A0A9D5HIS1_9LILI|nr:hypothetical protein J5N97_013580 [Dioscorea zingiberensis]